MKRNSLALYGVLIVWYLTLVITNPTDQATIARRHLSHEQAMVLGLAIAVPVIIIWLIAFYGAERLLQYSRSIKHEVDGPHFLKLSQGLLLLALYLPFRMILKVTMTRIAEAHPAFTTPANVIVTYATLIFPLVAFVVIGQAARGLGQLAKTRASLRATYILGLLFICFATLYCYGVFAATGDVPPTNWLVTSQQAIPLVLKVLTIVVPYLLMWLIGVVAAYEIYLYQHQVQGIFYRQALRLLATGLVMVIFVSMGIQFIGLIAPSLINLPLKGVLLISYSMLMLLGVAFFMIARGVDRLRQLEQPDA